tara:strand:- start:314 stop:460 length:147 start_codon:yes stop_codon:yes gene_type:complete
VWHSLDESGVAKIYDVKWPDGTIERDISVNELESVKQQEHHHNVQERD